MLDYTVNFPPVCGTLNKKLLLRAPQNQEGDADASFTVVTVYLFLEKDPMSLFVFDLYFNGVRFFC